MTSKIEWKNYGGDYRWLKRILLLEMEMIKFKDVSDMVEENYVNN